LYILLGLSAVFFLMGQALLPNLVSYIGPYEAQMLLNFAWSVVFFGLQKPKISLVIIFGMIVLTAYLLWISWGKKRTVAFWMLLPYFLWILFAMYLNFYIVIKNKEKSYWFRHKRWTSSWYLDLLFIQSFAATEFNGLAG
jgi:tryptophan-rich sensory protein